MRISDESSDVCSSDLSVISTSLLSSLPALAEDKLILNASYDIAREVFAEINPKLVAKWKAETGKDLVIDKSFAGTSRQDRKSVVLGKSVPIRVDLGGSRLFKKKLIL